MSVVVPASLHSIQKSNIEKQKVRSEDELLKFFLHGSYDVQRGHVSTAVRNEIAEQTNPTIDIDEDKIKKSRCMFEETYMINISVQKPDAKQIDVRIEKSSLEGEIPTDKLDAGDDEISSIFDDDEIDKVMLNGINSTNEPTQTNLTLADMISKSLTTIPSSSVDNLNKISQTNHWFVQQKTEVKSRKISAESLPGKPIEGNTTKVPSSTPVRQPILTSNSKEDEKLYKYLDYLYTKEEKPKTQPQPQPQPKVPIVQTILLFFFNFLSFFFDFVVDKTISSTIAYFYHRSRTTLSFINSR